MDPRLFGEFMGTMVLALLGNGAVANVVLKKTLGSAAGWLTIVFGYGVGVMVGSRPGLGAPRGVHPVLDRPGLGRLCGGSDPVAAFFPALGRNRGRWNKARLFLYRPCHPEYLVESPQRDHRDVLAGVSGSCDGQDRTSGWISPFSSRSDHLGYRLRPGRHHRIRH